MSKLRVVQPGEETSEDVAFADAARAALDAAIAAGAVVLVILYETGTKIDYSAVPKSDALARGLVRDVSEILGASE